jgi:hypothetical protein
MNATERLNKARRMSEVERAEEACGTKREYARRSGKQ